MPRPRRKRTRAELDVERIVNALCFVRLDALAAAGDNGARWIQVAYQGAWKGYARGEFELSQADLEQMVENFRRHPSYKAGAELASSEQLATGAYDVIPFDWRHASTSPAGATPLDMQIAQAWACDMKVAVSTAGKAELWAFTRYLEPMGTYVATGKVHWTSITADPHFIDPVTAEDRGWYVEAIAFTNDPFLQGMSVAADRSSSKAVASFYRSFDPYCPPKTPGEVLECLRELLELPATADAGAVFTEIAKLAAWTQGGGAPEGVEVDELVGAMRQIFNLPTLAEPAEVFAAADGLLAALAAAAAETSGGQASAGLSRETSMLNAHLLKILAKLGATGVKLGRASTDEDAVEAVLEAFGAQRIALEGGATATAGLTAVLTALGVEDVAGATKKIAEMFKSVDMLEKAMPELKSLRDAQAESEDASAEKDTEEAMAAHRMPDTAKPALLAMRTGGVAFAAERTPTQHVETLAKRTAARKAFLESYPVASSSALALTRQALPNPAAGSSPKVLGAGNGNGKPLPVVAARGIGGEEVIDLSSFEGNRTEKALQWVDANDPKAKSYDRPSRFYAARKLLQQPNVVGAD